MSPAAERWQQRASEAAYCHATPNITCTHAPGPASMIHNPKPEAVVNTKTNFSRNLHCPFSCHRSLRGPEKYQTEKGHKGADRADPPQVFGVRCTLGHGSTVRRAPAVPCHVSCLCRIMELCAGVCIVGVRARVLARACARVLRRRRRTSLLTLETACPFPSCRTTGPRCEREGTRHAVHCSRKFF